MHPGDHHRGANAASAAATARLAAETAVAAVGVPFDVVCQITNLSSSTAFELLELLIPPTSSLPGTVLRPKDVDGHGQASSVHHGEAGCAASLVCLRQQATLGALGPGESASVALELAALHSGTLREELSLRIHDLVGGGVFVVAAPIEVSVGA